MNFTSDNCSGVHPDVMAALVAANDGHVRSYGADALTEATQARLREVFDAPEAVMVLTATGTAANAIGLGAAVPPWGRVFCHQTAHIDGSECGAPEFFTGGAKMTLLPGEGGVFTPKALADAVEFWTGEGLNGGQPAAVSVTQATEWGQLWTAEKLAEIGAIARANAMVMHMDGSRFANAAAASGDSPAAMTHQAGVDLLSFGGTKNGAMGVEAIIAFDPALADRLAFVRKRGGHLFSKHRYLAAQMSALLENDLWLRLGRHANEMAAHLADRLARDCGIALAEPVATNQVFALLPAAADVRARAGGARYNEWPVLGSDTGDFRRVRLVCDWSTTEHDIDALIELLRG